VKSVTAQVPVFSLLPVAVLTAVFCSVAFGVTKFKGILISHVLLAYY
jgi:hypothetical protein